MGTQLSSAKRGIFTEEIKQVAKSEDVDVDYILRAVAKGSIIIPKNTARKQQQIKVVGIGKGLKTKVNVNIGTSTLYQNIEGDFKSKSCCKVWSRYNNGSFRWW